MVGAGWLYARSDGEYRVLLEAVFNGLEGSVGVCLANPEDVKGRRGHKTDRKDAKWLAHLLRHAMIRASFVPARPIRELRDLTRRRKQLLGDATSERNRIQKTLEDANVKLGSVLSDVFGVSGQNMLLVTTLIGGGCLSCEQYFMWPGAKTCCGSDGHCKNKTAPARQGTERECKQIAFDHQKLMKHQVEPPVIAAGWMALPVRAVEGFARRHGTKLIDPSPPGLQVLHSTFLI